MYNITYFVFFLKKLLQKTKTKKNTKILKSKIIKNNMFFMLDILKNYTKLMMIIVITLCNC